MRVSLEGTQEAGHDAQPPFCFACKVSYTLLAAPVVEFAQYTENRTMNAELMANFPLEKVTGIGSLFRAIHYTTSLSKRATRAFKTYRA